jgi:hypothetical protein
VTSGLGTEPVSYGVRSRNDYREIRLRLILAEMVVILQQPNYILITGHGPDKCFERTECWRMEGRIIVTANYNLSY